MNTKQTFNLIAMAFLVCGLWYVTGYLQGYEAGKTKEEKIDEFLAHKASKEAAKDES